MLRGLPASGKSTKRKELLADPSLQPIMAVNKDDIRLSKGIDLGNFRREKEVKAEEERQITEVLESGVSLIVDNTHNSPKYLDRYKQMAKAYGYQFVLIDLSHVPVEECIRRDALRTGREHVGEEVILKMYNDFYNPNGPPKLPSKPSKLISKEGLKAKKERPEPKPRPEPMKQDPALPKALIVDLDGTLAMANGRSWYEYWKCTSDIVMEPIKEIMFGLLRSNVVSHIIFLTGREDSGRTAASLWLETQVGVDWNQIPVFYQIPVFHLCMKATGDHRPDFETKRELFDNHVRDKFYVVAILEDRSKVVNMWREMGLTCLQVADGDY
jgi:predicted kinase